MELSDGERAALREELAVYLDEFRGKLGSDGEQLVHFPANFEVVADSMNRSDLTSAEEKPWSKYLLSSDKMEDTLDVDGRYRNVLSEQASETKYVQGIAQIQMYDKQLLSISRRAAQLKATLSAAEADDDGDAMSTGRRSDRSGKSLFFLTKGRSEMSTTPRSQSGKSTSPDGHAVFEEEQGEEEKEGKKEEGATPSSISMSESKTSSTKKRNIIHENIRAVGNPHASLSSAEEYRLQTLLDIDEGGKEWQKLSKFGFSNAQVDHVAELDEQLQRFRPLDAASSTSSLALEGSASDDHYDTGGNYLLEQRLARQQSDYAHKLESMLRSYATEKADLSGLLVDDGDGGREHDLKSTRSEVSSFCSSHYQQGSSSMLSLPHPSTVDAKHRVTVREVENIIAATKSLFLQDSSNHNSATAASLPSSHSTQSLESQALAPRQDIDRLLGSLRFEVQRLAMLREKKRGASSPQGNSTPRGGSRASSRGGDVLHNGADWQHISPSGSDLEDQMAHMQDLESDILLRFGVSSPHHDGALVPSNKLQQPQPQPQHHQQQKHFTHASFCGGQDGPNHPGAFLPLIKSGPLQTSDSLVRAMGYSPSLPLIAESFRQKVKSLRLRATRGVIGDPPDPVDNAPPPPPPGTGIRIII